MITPIRILKSEIFFSNLLYNYTLNIGVKIQTKLNISNSNVWCSRKWPRKKYFTWKFESSFNILRDAWTFTFFEIFPSTARCIIEKIVQKHVNGNLKRDQVNCFMDLFTKLGKFKISMIFYHYYHFPIVVLSAVKTASWEWHFLSI